MKRVLSMCSIISSLRLVLYTYYSIDFNKLLPWILLEWIRKKIRFCVHGQTSIFCTYSIENSGDPKEIFLGKEASDHTTSHHVVFSRNSNFQKQNIPWGRGGEWVETIQIKCHGLQLLQSLWQPPLPSKKHTLVWELCKTSGSSFPIPSASGSCTRTDLAKLWLFSWFFLLKFISLRWQMEASWF